MDNIPHSNPDTIRAIKEWLTPILTGIIGLFIWTSVSEMRSDIKLLLMQQSADKVRIDNIESDVTLLKSFVYQPSKDMNKKDKEMNLTFQPAKKEEEQRIH